MLSSPKVWENLGLRHSSTRSSSFDAFASREGRQNCTSLNNARRPATRRSLKGHLLENPTFREMYLVCAICSEKVTISFSKTILESFFSFLQLRNEYREFDAEGRTSTATDWIRPSVDP